MNNHTLLIFVYILSIIIPMIGVLYYCYFIKKKRINYDLENYNANIIDDNYEYDNENDYFNVTNNQNDQDDNNNNENYYYHENNIDNNNNSNNINYYENETNTQNNNNYGNNVYYNENEENIQNNNNHENIQNLSNNNQTDSELVLLNNNNLNLYQTFINNNIENPNNLLKSILLIKLENHPLFKDDEIFECPISLETINKNNEVYLFNCLHIFDKNEIEKHIKINNACPICRLPLI